MTGSAAIRTNDTVLVLTGKDRGKKGKVTQVLRSERQVVVDGLNTRYKNVRARRQGEKGQRIEFHAPMDLSNVILVCPKCSKPTRISIHVVDNGAKRAKERHCKKCHGVIST